MSFIRSPASQLPSPSGGGSGWGFMPPGALVVAEVDRRRLNLSQALQRPKRRRHVVHHRPARRFSVEHLDRPAGVSGDQRPALGRLDLDALMTKRVPGRRDHPNVWNDLGVTIEQVETRARILEPGGRRFVSLSILPFPAL